MSEHTAEFSVVPRIRAALLSEYDYVVPLHFWLTREGANLAQRLHGHEQFRSIAVFPRRPKMSAPSDWLTIMTINDSVLETASNLKKLGVPSIAACPMVRSLWELGESALCAFVDLTESTPAEYTFDHDQGRLTPSSHVLGSDNELRKLVASAAWQDLDSLKDAVRVTRSKDGEDMAYGPRWFSRGYKPVFLLIK